MADEREAAHTEDYWAFVPYSLTHRGENSVPERLLAGAQWEGHHRAGLGYYARTLGYEDERPVPVEFNPEHLAWVEI